MIALALVYLTASTQIPTIAGHAPPVAHSAGERRIRKCIIRKIDDPTDRHECIQAAEYTCPGSGNGEQAGCMMEIDLYIKQYSIYLAGSRYLPQFDKTSYVRWSRIKEKTCDENADLIGSSHTVETMVCLIDARIAIVQRHAPEPSVKERSVKQLFYEDILKRELRETAENMKKSTADRFKTALIGSVKAARYIQDDPKNPAPHYQFCGVARLEDLQSIHKTMRFIAWKDTVLFDDSPDNPKDFQGVWVETCRRSNAVDVKWPY